MADNLLWRSRWAAIGAAVAVTLGAGGLYTALAGSGASVFVPIAPTRVLDTRINAGLTGQFTSAQPRLLDVTGTIPIVLPGDQISTGTPVPDGATAIVANVTAVDPATEGFVSVRPGDITGDPITSNINTRAAIISPNLVTVALPTSGSNTGQIQLWYQGLSPAATTHLLVDIVGYYQPGAAGPPGPPGPPGPSGPVGPVNRLDDVTIAQKLWVRDPGRPATITVGSFPRWVASDGTHVWVANTNSNTISKIDPVANTVIATIPVGPNPAGMAFDGTTLWVAIRGGTSITPINVTTNAVGTDITGISNPVDVLFDGTHLWISSVLAAKVYKVDPDTRSVTPIDMPGTTPAGELAFDGTSIWVTLTNIDQILRIDATTTAIGGPYAITGSDGPRGIAFDGRYLWTSNFINNSVSKFDPVTQATVGTPIVLTSSAQDIVYDGEYLYVPQFAGNVAVIRAASSAVLDTIPLAGSPAAVDYDGTNIWVVQFNAASVTKFVPY